jgi:ribonuclease E
MKNKTIIIDAAHREETRVAVLEDNILQDFDRDAIAIKQIKGNIYLAKVARVEASLQAAFIDYDGDRNGFLPFAEIHPEYFQLSEAEKQKLFDLTKENSAPSEEEQEDENPNRHRNRNSDNEDENSETIATGSYSVEDETGNSRYQGNIHNIHKRYNIQDVIKPGQLIIIQVVKEERGNKGASMTSYISLAGKYCVLMPNTPNKGGVSKKVDNFRDRKLLKSILNDLEIPSDKSVIIRTAGVGKKPEEIKRDFEYLSRLWTSIKEACESSKAPTFIHAEDDVIKKCIRDVYNDQVFEVVVEGQEAYNQIINFVRMTMSSEAKNIRLHQDRIPVFNKYRVEQQISSLYEKQISLPSGGSIVIDHSEALVAIDVNSGKSTRESGVEETAFQTNLEAAKEIARQLRLRDLAGLIVIDFIDMYDQRHRRTIERTIRDELQNDRARIQLGRISIFGLLEMSRQRLGASFFETITQPCKHCSGTGYVRSVEILAVSILRSIRYSCTDNQVGVVYVYTSAEVISYMLNFKKNDLANTEKNYNIHIFMHLSEDVGSQGFSIKKRKSLSDFEKREIEMEIATGKVNQLGLEKNYFEANSIDDSESSDLSSDRPQRRNDDRFRKNYKRNNNHNKRRQNFNFRTKQQKKGDNFISSFLSGIFGKK